ncbi:MAG: hypothetical protein RLZZ165_2480 [Bacteroidota bacterium]|jgi:hypothetical protein
MKQHISLIFSLALLLAVSFGCKVGDEDPASLASRDGRLAATWNLTAAEVSDYYKDPNVTRIKTESYDGTTWTTTETGQNTTTESYGYEMQLVIEKEGTASIIQTFHTPARNVVNTDSTLWSWVDAGKKKSMLNIYSTYYGGPDELVGTWEVVRLSKKELILYQHSKVTSDIDSGSDIGINEYTRNYTFEAE